MVTRNSCRARAEQASVPREHPKVQVPSSPENESSPSRRRDHPCRSVPASEPVTEHDACADFSHRTGTLGCPKAQPHARRSRLRRLPFGAPFIRSRDNSARERAGNQRSSRTFETSERFGSPGLGRGCDRRRTGRRWLELDCSSGCRLPSIPTGILTGRVRQRERDRGRAVGGDPGREEAATDGRRTVTPFSSSVA